MNSIAKIGSLVQDFYDISTPSPFRLGCGVVGAALGGIIFTREATLQKAEVSERDILSPLAHKTAVLVAGSATGFALGILSPFVVPAIVASVATVQLRK